MSCSTPRRKPKRSQDWHWPLRRPGALDRHAGWRSPAPVTRTVSGRRSQFEATPAGLQALMHPGCQAGARSGCDCMSPPPTAFMLPGSTVDVTTSTARWNQPGHRLRSSRPVRRRHRPARLVGGVRRFDQADTQPRVAAGTPMLSPIGDVSAVSRCGSAWAAGEVRH